MHSEHNINRCEGLVQRNDCTSLKYNRINSPMIYPVKVFIKEIIKLEHR